MKPWTEEWWEAVRVVLRDRGLRVTRGEVGDYHQVRLGDRPEFFAGQSFHRKGWLWTCGNDRLEAMATDAPELAANVIHLRYLEVLAAYRP